MNIRTILQDNYSEKDGVFYFIDVPTDIKPSTGDATDRQTWSDWRMENYVFFKRELARIPNGAIVVDVGAGRRHFRDLFERFKAIPIDFYPYDGIRVICDFNASLPFKDHTIDALVLSNVLEHVKEPGILLQECFRILKPGGILFGSTPYQIALHQRPYDYYRYTDYALIYLLEKYGFRDCEVTAICNLFSTWHNATSRLFFNLIHKTKFSKNPFVQQLSIFCIRIVWVVVRAGIAVADPFLKKCAPDIDIPRGYVFKAYT